MNETNTLLDVSLHQIHINGSDKSFNHHYSLQPYPISFDWVRDNHKYFESMFRIIKDPIPFSL